MARVLGGREGDHPVDCRGCPDCSWDNLAADVGLGPDWREKGYDTPEYIMQEDSIYRLSAKPGRLRCPFPDCTVTKPAKWGPEGVTAMFRHIHDQKKHPTREQV